MLCGGAVYRVTQQDWNFEELPTIDLGPEGGTPPIELVGEDTGAGASAARARVYRLRGAKGRVQRVSERARALLRPLGAEASLSESPGDRPTALELAALLSR